MQEFSEIEWALNYKKRNRYLLYEEFRSGKLPAKTALFEHMNMAYVYTS